MLESKRELTALKMRAGEGWSSAQTRIDTLLPKEEIVIQEPEVRWQIIVLRRAFEASAPIVHVLFRV